MKNPYEKNLMANPYGPLKVEETNEKSITSKNMLRNRKKELKEKEIKYKNNVWNRIRYFDIPYWSYNKHGLFPLHMRRVIVSLFCFHNRNNTLFSILPRSILIDLLELNMRWIDCGKDTNPRENQVIIPYSTGKGEKMVYHIRWYGEWVCVNKN